MAPVQLGREEQMLAFFVQHCSGRVGRTQLLKYLYLADYEARRYIGRQISAIEYIWYHHGPYDRELYNRLDELKAAGVVREDRVTYPTGKEGYIYYAGERDVTFTLAPDEMRILAYVCHTYSRLNLQTLLDDVVYETEPMQKARVSEARNQPLDMSTADNQRRFDLGIPYEELLRRSADARAGKAVPHEEAMKMIRDALREDAA